MQGFTVSLGLQGNYPNKISSDISDFYSKDHFVAKQFTNKKFAAEKVFSEIDSSFYCFNGVLLNGPALKQTYACADYERLFAEMYKRAGISCIDEFRGNFNGFIYSKDTIHAYTNYVNSKPLFYWSDKQCFAASSDLFDLIELLKANNISLSYDEDAMYMMLTYGYMLDEYTIVKEIRRLDPGSTVSFSQAKGISIHRYHQLDNTKYTDFDEAIAIKEIHKHLERATKMEFEKDQEYGYSSVSLISGGLDSRMVAYYAKHHGIEDVTLVNFGTMGSKDTVIANDIALELQYEYVFKDLGYGNYLKSISDPVTQNNGTVFYLGSAHARSALKSINWDCFGLLHNGNLADMIHGDYLSGPFHAKAKPGEWGTSNMLADRIVDVSQKVIDRYPNLELFALYNRGSNAILNGDFMAFEFTETAQCYLDRDAAEYAMTIHPKYKYGEANFIKMINQFFPKASMHKWEKWGMKPSVFNSGLFNNKITSTFIRGKKYITRKFLPEKQKSNMNPFRFWMQKNPGLISFLGDFYLTHKDVIKNKSIQADAELLFTQGNLMEKSLVLTLLDTMRQISI